MSSHETLVELSEVLSKKKFDKYISIEERRSFLQLFIQTIQKVEIIRTVRECRDPKDDKFLELALNGKADFLVTGDEDLLSIGNFQGTVIITASDFLDHITSNL